jgi:two-component system response regulator
MVYLVDDDVDDLSIVQEALVEYSYKGPVNTMGNGQVLLKHLESDLTKPGVIILDLNMPLIDGFTALRTIKTSPTLKSIPVIILTASSNKADELRCFELGCDFFLNKPVKPSEYAILTSIVKNILSRQNVN